ITVIGAAFDEVEFVAAAWSHFMLPEPAVRSKGDPKRVAVPQRPDLRSHSTPCREGIVLRHRTVRIQPKDLADIAFQILRRGEFLPVARTDEQMAPIGREENPVSIM